MDRARQHLNLVFTILSTFRYHYFELEHWPHIVINNSKLITTRQKEHERYQWCMVWTYSTGHRGFLYFVGAAHLTYAIEKQTSFPPHKLLLSHHCPHNCLQCEREDRAPHQQCSGLLSTQIGGGLRLHHICVHRSLGSWCQPCKETDQLVLPHLPKHPLREQWNTGCGPCKISFQHSMNGIHILYDLTGLCPYNKQITLPKQMTLGCTTSVVNCAYYWPDSFNN